VLAGSQAGDIGDNLHLVTRLRECDHAFNVISLGRMEDGDRFGWFLGESRGADERERSDCDETKTA